MSDSHKTPLYAEDLLALLRSDIAGYNGSCGVFVKYYELVEGLKKLIGEQQ